MAVYGRQLLKRISIRYCPLGGSSSGVREYIEKDLPLFQRQHEHVTVRPELRRGHHPYIEAEFEHADPSKSDKLHTHTVALRNLSRQEVRRELWWLCGSQGRPQSSRAPPRRVVSRRPSIQGAWSVTTFAAAAAQRQ
ncbi:MAG: hypothetical protein J3K34DRAFT_410983 [Monoraphidium minutum]|nr:MAG: hypothetical protein J3K34DRAFT_410983 [Monoraphidium minutum]